MGRAGEIREGLGADRRLGLKPSLGPGLHLTPLGRFPWISGMSPSVLTGARLTRNSLGQQGPQQEKAPKVAKIQLPPFCLEPVSR